MDCKFENKQDKPLKEYPEQKNNIILENMQSGVILFNEDRNITFCNKYVERIFNKKINTIINHKIDDYFPEIPKDKDELDKVINNKKAEFEKRITDDNSNNLYVSININHFSIYNQKLYIVEVHDISTFKVMQKEKQQIAENERTLRQIMLISANTLDFKKTINSIVTKAGEYFKADRCFYISINFEKIQHNPIEDYAEYLSSKNIRSHRTRQPTPSDTEKFIKNARKDKVVTVDDITKINLPPETKKMLIDDLSVKSYMIAHVYYNDMIYGSIVLHYVNDFKRFTQTDIDMGGAIAHNAASIIHQSKLYEEMQKNLRREKTILDNIHDAIITINNNFIIETCNPSVEDVWGYSVPECLGQPLNMLLNFDCSDKENNNYTIDKSVYGIRKNGEKFSVEINQKEVIIEDRKLILLVIRDITEREKVDKIKREFISTVSHELRTPLTAIRGSIDLIASGKIGEISQKIKDLLNIATNNCLRLITLINDILDIEKLEAGKMEFKLNIVDIIPLIEQVIQLNSQYAQKFNVNIKFENSIGQGFVNIDNDRLIQVITNLLSNAVKFSLPESSVDITAKRNSGNIIVSITNYGIEIPEEFKDSIFQKFAQADSSDSRQKGGTGLGLSISKTIIENLNGSINFVSENNQTTFYFELQEIQNKK